MPLESSPDNPQPVRGVTAAVRGWIDRLGAILPSTKIYRDTSLAPTLRVPIQDPAPPRFDIPGPPTGGKIHPPAADMQMTERTRLGLLLQCKGLMEIVAATILVQAGLITPTVFAVLVTLALISTTLTVPLFRSASRARAMQRKPAG